MKGDDRFVGQMRLLWLVKGDDVDEESFGNLRQPHSNVRQYPDGHSRHLHIYVQSVVVQLIQQITQIVLIGKQAKDPDFNIFDVGWLIYLAVEVFEVFLVVDLPVHVLDHILDVLEDNEGRLESAGVFAWGHQSQQGRLYLLHDLLVQFLFVLGQLQNYFDWP